MLKMERLGGIFGDKNLSSTIRVGVRIPSLLDDIRLNSMTGTQQFKPSLNSSSGKRVSNLIIPCEKIKVEGMYADNLCTESSGESRHVLAWKIESKETLTFP